MRAWQSASKKKMCVRWDVRHTAFAAVTPKERTKKNGTDGKEEDTPSLILSVTENGYGKRTDVDEYRLQSRGGKGVINVKTTQRNGKVGGIMLVSEHSECMVISQFGKIIRIETSQIREAGRSTQGVRLLQLDSGDRVAAAVVIPQEEVVGPDNGTLLQ
jgi:DNA gyrase subunit A